MRKKAKERERKDRERERERERGSASSQKEGFSKKRLKDAKKSTDRNAKSDDRKKRGLFVNYECFGSFHQRNTE